jgi:hypothetical protein
MIPLPGSLGSPYLALKAGFFVDVLLRHPLQQLGLVLLDPYELVGAERCPTTPLHVPHLCLPGERCRSGDGEWGSPVGGSGPRAQAH